MALVTPADLGRFLQRAFVDQDSATIAVRVAEGWLRSVIPGTEWPDPVPEDLWAWALELASIAYANPETLQSRTVDAVTDQWSVGRRAEILAEASARYGDGFNGGGSGSGGARGSFPPPSSWPDPAERVLRGGSCWW